MLEIIAIKYSLCSDNRGQKFLLKMKKSSGLREQFTKYRPNFDPVKKNETRKKAYEILGISKVLKLLWIFLKFTNSKGIFVIFCQDS